MLNLKKTAAAVLALSSSAAFAGTMGPVCSAVNVTVPCESTAWDVGARALYLQPSFAGGNFGYAGVDANNNLVSYDDQWGWGFMIEGSYHFETGSDANLNWWHLSKSSNGTHGPGASVVSLPGFGTITGTATGTHSGKPSWDAVNLEFGQHVDFGEKKSIRFHGGFQYARIANDISINNAATVTTVSTPLALNSTATGNVAYGVRTSFNGFGPRAGADMGYAWGNGLSVYANAAASLLAGSTHNSKTLSSGVTGRNLSQSSSKDLVVPELEGKLGVKYDYAVAQGDLTFDAGWLWLTYFNVAQHDVLDLDLVGTNVTNANFNLQGLYFGLKWTGNVA